MGRSRRQSGSGSTLRLGPGDVIEGEAEEIKVDSSDGSSEKDTKQDSGSGGDSKERTSPIEVEYDLRVFAEGCVGADIKGLAKSFAAPSLKDARGSRTLLGTVKVKAGVKVSVQPIPDQAWKFSRWMGDGQGNPTLEVEMDGDKEIIVVAQSPEEGHKERRKKIRIIQKKRAAHNKPRMRVRLYDKKPRPSRYTSSSSSS